MPQQHVVDIIKELNRLLRAKYPDFKGSYLYGSRTRDDYRPDSDIDIVAVFESIDRDKGFETYGIVADLDYKYDVFISLFPYTLEKLSKNPVYYSEVVEKGIFYEAAA